MCKVNLELVGISRRVSFEFETCFVNNVELIVFIIL